MLKIIGHALLAGLLMAAMAAPASAEAAKFLKRVKDWSAYMAEGPNGPVCFAIARPVDTEPKNVKRGPIYFYVTTWPKRRIAEQISVKIGYPFKPDSVPRLTIGAQVFNLFPKGERAFIERAEDGPKVVAAMRRGAKMVVTGISKRGTLTTDVYSLAGVTAALKQVRQACAAARP